MAPANRLNYLDLLRGWAIIGRVIGGLKGRESIASASWWLLVLTVAMLALSFLPDLMKQRKRSTV